MVGSVGGNFKVLLHRRQRDHLVRHLRPRNAHHADAGEILPWLPIGCVMHLEHKLRPGRDPPRIPRRECRGPLARHIGGDKAHAAEVGDLFRTHKYDCMVNH